MRSEWPCLEFGLEAYCGYRREILERGGWHCQIWERSKEVEAHHVVRIDFSLTVLPGASKQLLCLQRPVHTRRRFLKDFQTLPIHLRFSQMAFSEVRLRRSKM